MHMNNNLILKNVTLCERVTDITIDRESGKIVSTEPTSELGRDMGGACVIAGFVDIHTHGCLGHDTMDGDSLAEMSDYLASRGTTSWCPTTMTAPVSALRTLIEKPIPSGSGAHILGFHLEGPYISAKYCGAQRADLIKAPSPSDFEGIGNISLMTLAPETEGAVEFIKSAPFPISLGHTGADYATAMAAFAAGADSLTHVFNAMAPLHHREPALPGAAADSGAYVQVICDGNHLHPATVRLLYRLFGRDRMILISDSMRAAGLPDGDYELGGQPVYVRGGVARTASGALAGSTSTLSDCVRYAISIGIPRDDAIAMASETPARYLGISKGKVAAGYDADLLIVDEQMNVIETILCDQLKK